MDFLFEDEELIDFIEIFGKIRDSIRFYCREHNINQLIICSFLENNKEKLIFSQSDEGDKNIMKMKKYTLTVLKYYSKKKLLGIIKSFAEERNILDKIVKVKSDRFTLKNLDEALNIICRSTGEETSETLEELTRKNKKISKKIYEIINIYSIHEVICQEIKYKTSEEILALEKKIKKAIKKLDIIKVREHLNKHYIITDSIQKI